MYRYDLTSGWKYLDCSRGKRRTALPKPTSCLCKEPLPSLIFECVCLLSRNGENPVSQQQHTEKKNQEKEIRRQNYIEIFEGKEVNK